MANNVVFYTASSIPSATKGTAGGLIVSTNQSSYGAGGIYYDNGTTILNLGKGVCVRTIATNSTTTASSSTDTYTIPHSTVGGVVLRVQGVSVGTKLAGLWTPGTPTLTPGGGSNGSTWKISCPWTYLAPTSGAVQLLNYTYKIWYIPYN